MRACGRACSNPADGTRSHGYVVQRALLLNSCLMLTAHVVTTGNHLGDVGRSALEAVLPHTQLVSLRRTCCQAIAFHALYYSLASLSCFVAAVDQDHPVLVSRRMLRDRGD